MIHGLSQPERLSGSHNVADFDCGKQPLNDYLKRHALQSQNGDFGTTFVVHRGGVVLGYFTTAASAVEHDAAPDRMSKGGSRNAIPALLLGRLAVDQSMRGKRLGRALLREVFRRFLSFKDEIGMKAIITDAKDEEARDFYVKNGFTAFDEDEPLKLYILPKTIRSQLANP